jgi:hypothetical protein
MSEPVERVRLASDQHPRLRDGALPWVYYWLDLYAPDGRPANSKVLSAWGFFFALAAELWWGFQLTQPTCFGPQDAMTCRDGPGITWPFVALVVTTLAIAMGKDVFKKALRLRTED